MAKKKRRAKKDSEQKTSTKSKTKSKKSGYKRGSLGKAIYTFFDKFQNIDDIKYEECEKLAKSILSTTKFNKYHFSWYKNKYRELGGKKRENK